MRKLRSAAIGLIFAALVFVAPPPARARVPGSFADVIDSVQPKIVKLHGAGGFRGLEGYQSGFLISADGHVLSVWSYVLDTDFLSVTLDDGRRFEARVIGADPRLDLAVLKIEAENLPYFELSAAAEGKTGDSVLAFSNLFGVAAGDEAASVQHGAISIKCPLEARRGAFESLYQGQAYILDAMTNNPGAAGGALTDRRGGLLGMLGKELKNTLNNTWLNYAIPAGELAPTARAIIDGTFQPQSVQPAAAPENGLTADLLGLVLVPDVLERTPPFLDSVAAGTAAAKAGLLPDDLLLFVNDQLVQSCKSFVAELARFDRADPVKLTVIRDLQLVEVTLSASDLSAP